MHERIKADGTVVAAGSENFAAAAKLKSAKKRPAAEAKQEVQADLAGGGAAAGNPAKVDEAKTDQAKSEPAKSTPPKPTTAK